MKRLKSNVHELHVLRKARPVARRAILKTASDDLIKTLIECVLNTLNGNHPIRASVKNKLLPYKKYLRKIANGGISLKKKRKLIIQKGGFLIPLLTSILSGVIGSLISPSSS